MTTHLALALLLAAPPAVPGMKEAVERATAALVGKHGEPERDRVERGLAQASAMWRAEDGDAAAFEALAREHFAPRAGRATLLARFEEALEALDGADLEANRALQRHQQLDLGPMIPVDALFAAHDHGAHLVEDLYAEKLAFVALLNFPLSTLEEKLRDGARWSREDWAAAKLTERFALRTPATVNQEIARAVAEADAYIADLNVFTHHVLVGGARPFPAGQRLLSHWNLRDEIKAQYAVKDGLTRQRALGKVLERIAASEIPAAAVNSPRVDWDPFTNEVTPAPPDTVEGGAAPLARADPAPEPDTRFARLLATFRAVRGMDAYAPFSPTHLRRMEDANQMPWSRLEPLMEEVLASPLRAQVARRIEARLGRALEPFDLWYDGFRPRSRFSEADLDRRTRARYPTAEAFQRDLPHILGRLGFAPDKARFLAGHVVVEPARGSGHALQAARRGDLPHLRTRVGPGGMDWKGFDIAVHELGHNVEQVFSLYEVDRTLLAGVPQTGFTEALAFVFQARALEVLGLPAPTREEKDLLALHRLWSAAEIAGVGLVDLRVWRWMYAHPEATPAELRDATLAIAREVWNAHFEPLLGGHDSALLAVYSHMIGNLLYLPNYLSGELVAAALEEHLDAAPRLGPEFERIARYGSVSPDLWMQHAVGKPVGTSSLFGMAERALARHPPLTRK